MVKSKVTVLFITFLLLTAGMQPAKAAERFSDVKDHWAKNEIQYLSERHIIGGYPDGTFRPNEPITRVQASAMLIKALNIPLSDGSGENFKDVPVTSPYYKILATVSEKGILRGDNGYMRPGEKTTRAQMAAILRRAYNMPLSKQATFIDVSPAHWAYQDINGIAKERVAGGSEGKFMPSNAVTRAQFSAFLVRAMDENMKLSKYHSYIGSKGKTPEQNGFAYFTEFFKNDETYYTKLVKQNKADGSQQVILKDNEIQKSVWDFSSVNYLHSNTRLTVYNDELYIPYQSGSFHEAEELPFAYAVMKVKTDGRQIMKLEEPSKTVFFRNLFVWNDRIYYTVQKEVPFLGVQADAFIDDDLTLYSTKLDGKSDRRKEHTFTARRTYDLVDPYGNREEGEDNLSVLYDHSSIYYLNKKGVFAYSLLDKKTKKLSAVTGKRIDDSDMQIIVTDDKGKQHKMNKY